DRRAWEERLLREHNRVRLLRDQPVNAGDARELAIFKWRAQRLDIGQHDQQDPKSFRLKAATRLERAPERRQSDSSQQRDAEQEQVAEACCRAQALHGREDVEQAGVSWCCAAE